MRPDGLTIRSQEALQQAQRHASEMTHQAVDVEHLLLALLGQQDGIVGPLLRRLGVNLSQVTHALHGLGVHAEVRVIEYDFDQPFADLDEALRFWKHYLDLRLDSSRDARLRAFLGKRLRPWRGGWRAPIRKRSALLSWAPRRR